MAFFGVIVDVVRQQSFPNWCTRSTFDQPSRGLNCIGVNGLSLHCVRAAVGSQRPTKRIHEDLALSAQPVLVIRAPATMAALHYRAYEERFENGTVLDWILSRIRASVPQGVRVACLSESPTELRRLTKAYAETGKVEFCHFSARGETHLCRVVMDAFGIERLIMAGFGHAAAPVGLIRQMLDVHNSVKAELTDATQTTFLEPLYVVESSLIDEFANVVLPNVPQSVVRAAALLSTARARDTRLSRDFLWVRLDAGKCFGLEASRWPEQIAIRTPQDVAVLREAVARQVADESVHYIDAWKAAAIRLRAARLTPTKRPNRLPKCRRVRVLFAAYLPGFTGAHQSICHLVGALDRQRYEPLALVTHEGTFTDELRRREVHVICPQRDFSSAGIDGFKYAREVLAEYRPDLVHAQHAIGQGAVSAAIAAGVPLIQHVRVPDVSSLRHDIHAADVSIAVSDYVRKRIAALDVSLGRVEVILNGVDAETFKPEPAQGPFARACLNIPPDEFVVLMVARLAKNKRHDLVIKAVSQLRRTIGRGHLVIVGELDGDAAYKYEIETLMREDGLAGHTSTLDFVPDIRSVLHASDVMALPSEDEPLSRAVLDAMAVSVPPIVSDSGGSKEVIDDGQTGMVVAAGNVAQLANALRLLADDEAMRARMGMAAVNKIRSSLTAAHCAANTARVYERVLRGHYVRQYRSIDPVRDRPSDATSMGRV